MVSMFWHDHQAGELPDVALETAPFNIFLFGRMIGAAAEVAARLNRGRNMDTRRQVDQRGFVI